MKRLVLVIIFLFALAGCMPVQTAIPTYTIDPALLLTLDAIKRSPTKATPVTATPTAMLSPTLESTQQAAIASLTAYAKTQSSTPTDAISKVPSVTRKPSSTPKPTRTKIPSKTPTPPGPTSTPAPQDAPIRIFSPSSFSRLISPIKLVMSVIPGTKGNIYLQLLGEKSQLIYERKWTFPYANGRRTTISDEIEFTIPSVSESAHLKVFTYDEYGRLMSLASEDFILLSIGKDDQAEPENLTDPFALVRPYPEQIIKNNKIIINGMTRCRIDCRLLFEIVDNSGKSLYEMEQQDVIQASLDYQSIYYEIPIKVNSPTWVRLILHQQDIFTMEDIAVSSMVIKLTP